MVLEKVCSRRNASDAGDFGITLPLYTFSSSLVLTLAASFPLVTARESFDLVATGETDDEEEEGVEADAWKRIRETERQ